MKKKFTMLFAALLAFVGVANAQHWLQPTVWPGAEGPNVGREPRELNLRCSPNAHAQLTST